MHPDNAFYGHRQAYARWAGVDPDRPARAVLQHGWQPGTGLPARARLVSGLPRVVWSEQNAARARAGGIRGVVAVGSPLLYLDAIEPASTMPRAGTIWYPFHGWERADAKGSHDDLIAAIVEREPAGSTTVCLYWLEYEQDDVRRRYEEAGFTVVCNGRREDPGFLSRQLVQLRSHRRVCSNRVSTAVFSGAALGLEAEVYGPVFSLLGPEDADAFAVLQRSRWPELTDGGLGGTAALEVGATELGDEVRRAPGELREILGWARPAGRLDRLSEARVLAEHHVRRAAVQTASVVRRVVER